MSTWYWQTGCTNWLVKWSVVCAERISNVAIIWELAGNADSAPHPQWSLICIYREPQMTHEHVTVWEVLVYTSPLTLHPSDTEPTLALILARLNLHDADPPNGVRHRPVDWSFLVIKKLWLQLKILFFSLGIERPIATYTSEKPV